MRYFSFFKIDSISKTYESTARLGSLYGGPVSVLVAVLLLEVPWLKSLIVPSFPVGTSSILLPCMYGRDSSRPKPGWG